MWRVFRVGVSTVFNPPMEGVNGLNIFHRGEKILHWDIMTEINELDIVFFYNQRHYISKHLQRKFIGYSVTGSDV